VYVFVNYSLNVLNIVHVNSEFTDTAFCLGGPRLLNTPTPAISTTADYGYIWAT